VARGQAQQRTARWCSQQGSTAAACSFSGVPMRAVFFSARVTRLSFRPMSPPIARCRRGARVSRCCCFWCRCRTLSYQTQVSGILLLSRNKSRKYSFRSLNIALRSFTLSNVIFVKMDLETLFSGKPYRVFPLFSNQNTCIF
jgi:hypothetical protein